MSSEESKPWYKNGGMKLLCACVGTALLYTGGAQFVLDVTTIITELVGGLESAVQKSLADNVPDLPQWLSTPATVIGLIMAMFGTGGQPVIFWKRAVSTDGDGTH